ncbi:MAG TPA: type I restriction endonuclease [Anaerohalosphaeraceae bacterium]|nr:type I restriction endonuclease [Anaerohalosphaeraceae bacterium]HQG04854.1 type I restriction endonuclease [Anaerohalosphaeraceae bacterium]HQI08288.1 type I restriction endonuclease [Anaerohalosphaeraceae bacterium]HQJ68619.1 type I restriction endonuclease [Anaerohalosphaeraceae bacterium]
MSDIPSFSEDRISQIPALQVLINMGYEYILVDGLVKTNEKIYDLLSLGKSFEETIGGDTKSFTLNYIDWDNIDNNVFHVTAEFPVSRTGSDQTRRPDIVLFVNGIPLCGLCSSHS